MAPHAASEEQWKEGVWAVAGVRLTLHGLLASGAWDRCLAAAIAPPLPQWAGTAFPDNPSHLRGFHMLLPHCEAVSPDHLEAVHDLSISPTPGRGPLERLDPPA